jgi:glutamate carboxypeptidase
MVMPRLRPAMELNDKNLELFRKMNGILKENEMDELEYYIMTGGSDAANVSHSGVPTIEGMGVFGGDIHTLNEYAVLSSLAMQAKRLAIVAYSL